ncbi:MAG: hypothetical protein QF464_22985, partial [Myxococcota bacterium]|nr:hypothetical protein [Myxococcota bacterium]
GDFDGWQPDGVPTPDLAVVNKAFSGVAVFGNHRDGAQGFDYGLFPHADAFIEQPGFPTAGFSMTTVSGGLDVTGDGRVDIVVGSGVGEVLIIH